MSDAERSDPAPADLQPSPSRGRRVALFLIAVLVFAGVAVAVAALIVTMFHRKQEARHPFVRQVEVNEVTSDPVPWGTNWPREFDGYKRTVDTTRTRYGGSEAMPQQRIDRDPWLRRMYAGYAFSIDFRDRRGHAYMLYDQEQTDRVDVATHGARSDGSTRDAGSAGARLQLAGGDEGLRGDEHDALRGRARRADEDPGRHARRSRGRDAAVAAAESDDGADHARGA